MAEVRSPFNFVPLNVRIYSPSWAKLINQDIPFENGISGSLKMTIKAETPIFIRNGHTSEDKEAENERYSSFSKLPDGKFFIPGSSVKGEVRSVLEILSLGKTHVDPHAMYAWPRNPTSDKNTSKTKCGWLYKDSDDVFLIKVCKGSVKRISLWEIDRILGTSQLKEHFFAGKTKKESPKGKDEKSIPEDLDPTTAIFKYTLLKQLESNEKLCNLSFRCDSKGNCTYDPNGQLKGTIVMTGQPKQKDGSEKKKKEGSAKGKWKDFVFPTEIDHVVQIDKELYEEYQSLYKNSPDWAFRMKSIDQGVPVFLREDENGLINFGLTYMYKVPYERTPKDIIEGDENNKEHKIFSPDLAECIFGYIADKKHSRKRQEEQNVIQTQEDYLRGRVHFSHFVSSNAEPDESYCLALSGPKASYVPFYIRQNSRTGEYQTYNDGQLAGRKRYILRDSIWQKKAEGNNVNTTIHPLKAGCSFEGTIHFHNLLPEELGALLSALTFHGNSRCYHQLGQAKPYGFGKVSFMLSELKVPSYMETILYEEDYYMTLFEKEMCEFEPSWRYLPSIKELFTLSSMSVRGDDRKFQYMEMSMERGDNEFDKVREEKLYLQDFSKRIGKSVLPESCLERYKDQLDKIQAEKEKRKAEEERQREADEIAARKAQRSAAGLTLDELKADGVGFKVVSFKQALNKINRWIEASHVDVLPEKQCDELWITLQRLYAQPDKKEKKEWRDNTSKLWTKITELTSAEQAKAWFDALNN